MELRQLEYFQMASRLKNITRAAERLRVSQPNITVAIKKLEAELGIQLFDRSQKQLALTPEGAVFLNRIELAPEEPATEADSTLPPVSMLNRTVTVPDWPSLRESRFLRRSRWA